MTDHSSAIVTVPDGPKPKPTVSEFSEFKADLKEWIEVDGVLKELNKQATALRKRKAALAERITEYMRRFDIEDVNTRECRVRYTVRQARPPVNNSSIRQKLYEKFSENDVDEVFDAIANDSSRPVVMRPTLRRINVA